MTFLGQVASFSDVALVVLYLAIVAYLGWLGYCRTKTTTDYLLAGRKVHPFIMAMSYGATFISTSAIVGFGGVAAMFGMGLLWLTFLNIFVGIFIAFVFLGGRTRRIGHRLDAHTFPEFLGRRYDSKAIQVFAGLIIFVFMPLYAAAVMIGGTEFLTRQFNLDYGLALMIFAAITAVYVFFGGLKGVLYTDAFQGTIMTVGMLFLLIWGYYTVGGVIKGHTDLSSPEMTSAIFFGHRGVGHQGFTSMPAFGFGDNKYNLWWIVVSTIVMGVGIGVLAQPQLVVRFLTVKSGRELNRGLVYGGVFILLMTGVAFTVGALSNVYFYKYETIVTKVLEPIDTGVIAKKEPGQPVKPIPCRLVHVEDEKNGHDAYIVEQMLNPATKKMEPVASITRMENGYWQVKPHTSAFIRSVIPAGKDASGKNLYMFNSDSIIPTFVKQAMPDWFGVIFMLTLLAAAMSTMSSQYHAIGTAIGRDVCQQCFGAGFGKTVHVVRVGIVIGLLLAISIGYYMRGGYFIARATAIWFGLCASTFLPAYVGGLYFKRITRPAAIASMIVGLLATAFWLLLVKSDEAGAIGLVRLITPEFPAGSGAHPNSILYKYPNWPVVDPLFIALPLSTLTIIVVSLLTRRPSSSHLEKCFGPAAVEPAAAT